MLLVRITLMDRAITPMCVIHASRNEAINSATKRVYVAPSQRFHALRAITTLGGSYFYVAVRFTFHGDRTYQRISRMPPIWVLVLFLELVG